jgi:hypothetical protein
MCSLLIYLVGVSIVVLFTILTFYFTPGIIQNESPGGIVCLILVGITAVTHLARSNPNDRGDGRRQHQGELPDFGDDPDDG